MEYGRQGILAAYSSRLNPYALHPKEYELLRPYITQKQVTIYLNIRNGILRLWHRNPLVAVTKQEAAGCCRDGRHFALSQVAYEWLLRNGYINFGCVSIPSSSLSSPKERTKSRQKRIVVIGAGMSGLSCARQLEALFSQFEDRFTSMNQKRPSIIVLEGRNRIGGRVFSHPLVRQNGSTLPEGMRCTAEMGAQIVTGFENGNPLNFIVRGQLALRYHALRDNSVLYDSDGTLVNKETDLRLESLWNDILERAAVFRNKLPTVQTVEGDKSLLMYGEDPKEHPTDDQEALSALEDSGMSITVHDGNPVSMNADLPQSSAMGVEKLAGRHYHHAKASANAPAAQTAKSLGWSLNPSVSDKQSIDLRVVAGSSQYPTLGDAMDEGIRQYQQLINLTEQDLRLLNWHHANLEYANAVNVNQLSLGGWDQDIGNEFEGAHTEIIGGYTQVPRGLWRIPYPLDVRFRHAVQSISWGGETSKRLSPAVIKCTNGQSFDADHVILTTPLGVLKSGAISFQPPLPDWKTSCIERMGFGLLNKVRKFIFS
jgi:Flavin containing amine oxidoreductase/SWIRM domain